MELRSLVVVRVLHFLVFLEAVSFVSAAGNFSFTGNIPTTSPIASSSAAITSHVASTSGTASVPGKGGQITLPGVTSFTGATTNLIPASASPPAGTGRLSLPDAHSLSSPTNTSNATGGPKFAENPAISLDKVTALDSGTSLPGLLPTTPPSSSIAKLSDLSPARTWTPDTNLVDSSPHTIQTRPSLGPAAPNQGQTNQFAQMPAMTTPPNAAGPDPFTAEVTQAAATSGGGGGSHFHGQVPGTLTTADNLLPTPDLPAGNPGIPTAVAATNQPMAEKPGSNRPSVLSNFQAESPKVPAPATPTESMPGSAPVTTWVPAVAVGSQTVVQGGSLVVVSGVTVQFSAGSVFVGSNVAAVTPSPQSQQQQQQAGTPAAIGGLSFTPVAGNAQGSASAPVVIVSGQLLTDNGPPVTVNGNTVLYSSGSIHVGTDSAPAPTMAPQPPPQGASNGVTVIDGFAVAPVQSSLLGASNKPEVIVQGQTITQDESLVTIGGKVVAYSAGSVIVGTHAVPAPTAGAQQQQAAAIAQVIGGLTVTPVMVLANQPQATPTVVGGQLVSYGGFVAQIGTNVLVPGAAVTISGTPVSLGFGGLVIGSQTYAPARWTTSYAAAPAIATVAGATITRAPDGAVVFGTTTLTPGAPGVTVSGTSISLGASGLVIGSSTIPLAPAPVPSVFTVGGTTFIANPTGFSIAGTSLSAGGPALTLAGTPISLGPSGLVIGTSTIALASTPTNSVFTVGGTAFTANPTGFPIAGTTLFAGGPALTISGTQISLGPTALVIGTSTIPLASATSVFTVDGTTFTANPTGFSIAGISLSAGGPAVTLAGGTVVSLGPSGVLDIGTSTFTLGQATATPSSTAASTGKGALGGAILSGLQPAPTVGPGSTNGGQGSGKAVSGAARRAGGVGGWADGPWTICVGVVVLMLLCVVGGYGEHA